MSTLEWIMFSANFAFIITNLYGWLLKRYYVPVTLKEHFTMSDLAKHMGVNRNYLREVISRSGYETFYNMINTLRVAHACEILSENTSVKMEDVAVASGFSSGSAFSQVFKRIKGVTPKEFVHAE